MSALDIQKQIDEVETRAPERRADRDYQCPVCGQKVDRENLDQVHHHSEEPHQPLPE
jgi:hypothetical protein